MKNFFAGLWRALELVFLYVLLPYYFVVGMGVKVSEGNGKSFEYFLAGLDNFLGFFIVAVIVWAIYQFGKWVYEVWFKED